jgi:hypothetical protein
MAVEIDTFQSDPAYRAIHDAAADRSAAVRA